MLFRSTEPQVANRITELQVVNQNRTRGEKQETHVNLINRCYT